MECQRKTFYPLLRDLTDHSQVYYAYVCWKIPGKVRRNHMGFWLESNETSLEYKSKENLSSERNFTTIKISILLWTFSFFGCPIICTYSGILFRIRILVLQNITCVTWYLVALSPSTVLYQFSILYRYIFLPSLLYMLLGIYGHQFYDTVTRIINFLPLFLSSPATSYSLTPSWCKIYLHCFTT